MNESTTKPVTGTGTDGPAQLRAEVDAWERDEVARFVAKAPERQPAFTTLGGFPVQRTYTALDIADTPQDDIGLPGRFPYTRGPYPTMYRGST